MAIINLSTGEQDIWDRELYIPNTSSVLSVQQSEFWYIEPWNPSGIQHIETKGVSYCVWLAGFNDKTGWIWLAHLDDATNIPATIYLMRRVLNKFYLFTGLNPDFMNLTTEELIRQWWEVTASDVVWDGIFYNPPLANLLISVGWNVHHSIIRSEHPRTQELERQQWQPLSFVGMSRGVLLPAIEVTHSDSTGEDFRNNLWKRNWMKIESLLNNRVFNEVFDRWQDFFDNI